MRRWRSTWWRTSRRSDRSTDAGAVLTRALGLVERFVGAVQRLFERLAQAVGGDAGREGDEHLAAFVHEEAGAQLALQPRQHLLTLVDRRAGQQHDELLAAEARHSVHRAQRVADMRGQP